MLKMCFNPKVVALLAVLAVGVYLVAPNLIVAALPLLILAVCPLSMLLMGRAMMGGQAAGSGAETPAGRREAGWSGSPSEVVSALRAQVQSMSDQQAALQAELERLRQEGGSGEPRGALMEAEEVAKAASHRPSS